MQFWDSAVDQRVGGDVGSNCLRSAWKSIFDSRDAQAQRAQPVIVIHGRDCENVGLKSSNSIHMVVFFSGMEQQSLTNRACGLEHSTLYFHWLKSEHRARA